MVELRFPAEFKVFWPGKEVLACEHHKDGLLRVNAAMGGLPISVLPLAQLGITGECSNCVNEAGP